MKTSFKSAVCAFALAAGAALAPLSASAAAIGVDAGWYGFCFGGAGSPATEGCQNQGVDDTGNPTTFTALTNVLFQITDAFQAGDTFDVWINGIFAFTTNPVAVNPVSITGDPDLAFANPAFSHGEILLGPGAYSIDVFANASPFGGGGAYLQVVSYTPEPGTLVLLGIAALGLGFARRARPS